MYLLEARASEFDGTSTMVEVAQNPKRRTPNNVPRLAERGNFFASGIILASCGCHLVSVSETCSPVSHERTRPVANTT